MTRLTNEQIDNNAVDAFAAAMKAKLAQKRAEGRGGWHDPKQCSITYLEKLLHEHYRKGDVLDLANFCMILHQREGRPSRWRLTEPQEFAMAKVCLDLHDALGVKWGDDPYPVIAQAKLALSYQRDAERLDWMLSHACQSDGAWIGTFCLSVHQDGIRAAIDAAIKGEGRE